MARFTSESFATVVSQRGSRTNVITNSSCTFSIPTGATCASFELWGAGGSGGARCCCDCYHQGAGGAAGGYAAMSIPVSAGGSYSIQVGRNGYRDTYGETHPLCCGDGGTCTCVTGTNISCLNAGCGMAGDNNCYTYCLCGPCCFGYAPSFTSGATSSATAFSSARQSGSIHNWIDTGGLAASSCRQSGGYVGMGTDAQAWGQTYVTSAGGPAFRHGIFEQSLNCKGNYYNFGASPSASTTPQCLWFGAAGVGVIAETCCMCAYAPTGQHGAVIVRF